MDSPQSVVSPFKTSVLCSLEKQNSDCSAHSSGGLSKAIDVPRSKELIGILDVFVHQARDIHNICIYHKQDVYAKLCLTSDPENAVSTKIINGGGQNPVFNDNVQLNVTAIESSLKCEIYMMSRVRNYLEDQLLGFALVPLSELAMNNGKLESEFSLSSTDLFHSPAGFIQLSLLYTGTSPDVIEISKMPTALAIMEKTEQELLPDELDKVEFPDPQVVSENQMMVSQYFEISDSHLDSPTPIRVGSIVNGIGSKNEGCGFESQSEPTDQQKSLSIAITKSLPSSESGVTFDSSDVLKSDSPPSSVSTNGVLGSSHSPIASNQESENVSSKEHKNKPSETDDKEKLVKPLISVNIEPEQNVVQQEIIDMYMKSMQQFTESLAKMKLPLDIDNGSMSSSGSSSTEEKNMNKQVGMKNAVNGSKVFYGSRAFF